MPTVNTLGCVFCFNENKPNTLEVSQEQFEQILAWQSADRSVHSVDPNRHIQTACPSLSAGQREQLINGSHGSCYPQGEE